MVHRIREWADSASAMTSGTVGGVNWQENMAPSVVNNTGRYQTAEVRKWYHPDEQGWSDWGATSSVNSQTVIKLASDQTSRAVAGRKVRLRGGSATRFATIMSASFTSETSITLQDADGSLSASMSIVGFGPAPVMIPHRIDKLDVSGTLSVGTLVVGSLPNLTVAGSATLSGTVTMLTALNVSGTLSVGGATLLNNLTVAGSATLSGTVTIKTALHVSAGARAGSVIVTDGPGGAMALFYSSNDSLAIVGGGATNSYSISVAGFVAAATAGGHGVLFVDDANTNGSPRVVINGNGPYPIVSPSFGSLTAGAMTAGRLYQFWFQGGTLALLNPSVP
jgi:hypothetical protein